MRYKVVASAEAHGQTLASFTKSFRSFKRAARQATQYSRLYGNVRVVDQAAPTARGTLMVCHGSRKPKRGGGGTADFARCTLSSEAKKLLKKKRRR